MSVQWRGGSLYLSCSYLMYTHLLYLLPNKRNTSVLPTETARELAHWSPRARRCSPVLRPRHSGTLAPSEVLAYKHMGVCSRMLAASTVCPRLLVRREQEASLLGRFQASCSRGCSATSLPTQSSPQGSSQLSLGSSEKTSCPGTQNNVYLTVSAVVMLCDHKADVMRNTYTGCTLGTPAYGVCREL